MNRCIALAGCWLCMVLTTTAQVKYKRSEQDAGTFLRINPLTLLNIVDGGISAGAEHRFTKKFSVATDVTWIFYSSFPPEARSVSGWLLRPATRYYINERNTSFVEGAFHLKSVIYKIDDWLGRDCVNGVPSYEQKKVFRFRKQVAGFHVKMGWQVPLAENRKWWLEFYAGLGVRYRKQGVYKEPNSCYNRNNNRVFSGGILSLDEDSFTLPAIPAGARIIVRLY